VLLPDSAALQEKLMAAPVLAEKETSGVASPLRKVSMPRRVLTRRDLALAVTAILDEWFGSSCPPLPLTEAFLMRLAHDLARGLTHRQTFLLASPRSEEAQAFVAARGLEFIPERFQGDATVLTTSGGLCSQVTGVADTDPGIEHAPIPLRRPDSGSDAAYPWPFLKLLHGGADTLLYVGRKSAGWTRALGSLLEAGARDHASLWQDQVLLVVLMPADTTDRDAIRLGYGLPGTGSGLRFLGLKPSLEPWITGEEFTRELARLWADREQRDSPERERLYDRLFERNDFIWVRYGVPLMRRNRGRWAAITLEGEYLLGDSREEAEALGDETFGENSAYVARLDETRGIESLGPRSAHA